MALSTDPYLHLLEHRVVLDPGKEDPHGVGAVVQERDSCSVQLLRQLVDVRLQLGEGCQPPPQARVRTVKGAELSLKPFRAKTQGPRGPNECFEDTTFVVSS